MVWRVTGLGGAWGSEIKGSGVKRVKGVKGVRLEVPRGIGIWVEWL